MRKFFSILLFITVASCSNNSNDSADKSANAKTNESTTPDDSEMSPAAEKGLALVAKSDCLTCHKVAEASTGPAYEKVAARYPNNPEVIDSLSQKIIKGGSGNWGTVPMVPHPSISPEDAKSMVEYVLSLKK